MYITAPPDVYLMVKQGKVNVSKSPCDLRLTIKQVAVMQCHLKM
jgi:hypothetical protein